MKSLPKILSILLILFLVFTFITPLNAKSITPVNSGPVYRLSGADRYKTAVAISRQLVTKSNTVVIATGEGDDKFADALAGAPLAYAFEAPLLLTTTNKLNIDTMNEIVRLKAKAAIILGGTGVISTNVENELKAMGLMVERLAGKDRYETAVKIAEKLRIAHQSIKAFLTTGMEFQYSMMVAPYAARSYAPILFTGSVDLNEASDIFISWHIKEVEIVGNTDVVSQKIEDSLKAAGITVTRISGADISETNINAAMKYAQGPQTIAIARNDVFADGLAGGPFAAKENMPILLVGSNASDPLMTNFIQNQTIGTAFIFGGVGAVSDYIIDLIRKGDLNAYQQGNTNGNLNNGGIAAIRDGKIYYINEAHGYKLYKSNPDGTGKIKLSEDSALNINVLGDWVYYVNPDDNCKIYKIKTDGTCRTKLCDEWCRELIVVDNWIYYINENENNCIYKIATDGTFKTKLNNNESMGLNFMFGWIYYLNVDDGSRIYKVRSDGALNAKVSNTHASIINALDGWIYLSNLDDSRRLYKMNADGTGSVKLCDDVVNYINAIGSEVYYTNENDSFKMYKIENDGTNKVVVYKGGSRIMNILPHMSAGWIYFSDNIFALSLYKIRPDGTGLSPVD